MNKFRRNIDDFFRDKIGRPAETPPADVWADLEKRLDGLQTVPANPNRWMWHFAIVSLIVLLSVPFIRKMTSTSLADDTNKALAKQTDTHTQTTPAKNIENNAANAGNRVADATTETPAADGITRNHKTTPANQPENNTAATTTEPKSNNNGNGNNYQPVQHNALAGTNAPNSGTAKAHRSGQIENAAGAQESEYTANIFNSSKNTPVAETNSTDSKSAQEAAGANEQDRNKNDAKPANEVPDKKDNKDSNNKNKQAEEYKPVIAAIPYHSRIEAGIKGGYEGGFNPNAATKYVVSPYIQYSISEKFAIVAQPGVKYGTINNRSVGAAQSYYKTNDDGAATQVGNTIVTVEVDGASLTTKYTATYNYRQSHDSIVKSYTTGGSYIECELPLMLKYYINKDLSVYGGPNVVYGKAPGVTEHSTTQTIQRSVDVTTTTRNVPAPLPLSDVLTYNGVPYSQYSPLTPSNGSQLRVGYMLGFSYEYSKKWLFDALLQQGNAQPELKAGYNINSPLSVPYFRLSVGYKLTK